MTELFPFIDSPSLVEESETFFKQHVFLQRHLKKGEFISAIPESTVGFILKGALKVYFSDDLGEERLMFLLHEKTHLFTFTLNTFNKKISAIKDCDILFIRESDYYDFLLQSKSHLIAFINAFTKRYSVALQYSLAATEMSAKVKVYTFIYQLALKAGQKNDDDSITLRRMPKLVDIASITGTHKNNVSTYLKELEKCGVLAKEEKTYKVCDLMQLEDMLFTLKT